MGSGALGYGRESGREWPLRCGPQALFSCPGAGGLPSLSPGSHECCGEPLSDVEIPSTSCSQEFPKPHLDGSWPLRSLLEHCSGFLLYCCFLKPAFSVIAVEPWEGWEEVYVCSLPL